MTIKKKNLGRTSYFQVPDGTWLTVAQIAAYCDCSISSFYVRMRRGESIEEIKDHFANKDKLRSTCLVCSAPIGLVTNKKYCSDKCRRQGMPTVQKICELCGQSFYTQHAVRRFCSKDCQYNHNSRTFTQNQAIRELKTSIQRHLHCIRKDSVDSSSPLYVCKHYRNWLEEETKFCCATSVKNCRGYEKGNLASDLQTFK